MKYKVLPKNYTLTHYYKFKLSTIFYCYSPSHNFIFFNLDEIMPKQNIRTKLSKKIHICAGIDQFLRDLVDSIHMKQGVEMLFRDRAVRVLQYT